MSKSTPNKKRSGKSAGRAQPTPDDPTVLSPGGPGPGRSTPSSNDKTEVIANPADDTLIGAQVGNYRIECLLGKGGFGSVYKAVDVKLDMPVALKFLLDAVEGEHKSLFEREAKAIAALSKHPSIVQIHAWGEYQGRVYMALEYVESSAESVLKAHPEGVPFEQAARIVVDAARGLAFAHDQGILHRDVKPANILVEESGNHAKVADFGLARVNQSLQTSILAGRISGSPPFMSPEQAAGAPLDERSDIYSLGITLYNLLCGQLPCEGTSASRIMEKIKNDKGVPLSERRPDLPENLIACVDKATAHEPADRYQRAEEFAQDLEAIVGVDESTSRSTTRASTRANRVPIALAALVLVFLVAGFLLWPGGDPLAGPPERNASTPEKVIEYYLDAWRDGNYEAMYGALTRNQKNTTTFIDFCAKVQEDGRGFPEKFKVVAASENASAAPTPKADPFRSASATRRNDPFNSGGPADVAKVNAEPVQESWRTVELTFSNTRVASQNVRVEVIQEPKGWRIGHGGLLPLGGSPSEFFKRESMFDK